MPYVATYSDEYLEHYGILGMKWGRRRYQNPDGSLTPAGEARYNKLYNKASKNFTKASKKATKAGNIVGKSGYENVVTYHLDDRQQRLRSKAGYASIAASQYQARGEKAVKKLMKMTGKTDKNLTLMSQASRTAIDTANRRINNSWLTYDLY